VPPSSAPNRRDLRRAAIVAGTGQYEHADEWTELNQVMSALDAVADCLHSFDYVLVGAARYSLNPTDKELVRLLRSSPVDADVVIAYYTGHGHVDRLHYLVTRNSTLLAPEFIDGSAIPTRELPSLLAIRDPNTGRQRDPQPYRLIIIDTCFSGSAAVQIARDEMNEVIDPDRTWVIVSARAVQYAQQGAFPRALQQALAEPTAGRTQRYLSPDVLVDSINDRLPYWQEVRSYPPSSGVARVPPFFPNPEFKPVPAGLTLSDQKHWQSRLQGADAENIVGYYITGSEGRIAAVRDIGGWLSNPEAGEVAVVTGNPGSGKSALLALPALLSDPQYRDTLLTAARGRAIVSVAADAMGPGNGLIAVHGRGLNADQIAGVIAGAVGREATTAVGLFGALDREPITQRPVVLLDALDETDQPGAVIERLVSDLSANYGIRVLIGTRRHLLGLLPEPSLIVDLDRHPYADRQALTGYIIDLLCAAEEPGIATPYRQLDANRRNAIAEAVSEKAAGSFLIGQLVALALRGSDQPIDAQGTDWQDDIPSGVGAAFEGDLARLGDRSGTARALLTALAWAKGPGLPWENIWVPVASAIRRMLPGVGRERLGDADVRWLHEQAGAYIVEDVGPGGRSVFRLFHGLLAAHLRGESSTEQESANPTVADAMQQQRVRIEQQINDALLNTVPVTGHGRDWQSAHPYLRTYLAQHAHAAGSMAFFSLLQDVDFLAAADPMTLTPLLPFIAPESRDVARTYRRARPLMGEDLHANAAYLQEAARALTGNAVEGESIRPLYRTHLASVRRDDAIITLTGHPFPVESIAFGLGPDGRLLLAVSSGSRVRVWDPVTGEPVGRPLSNESRRHSLAFGIGADGRLLLAGALTACRDLDEPTYEVVRVWDPVTGEVVVDRELSPGWAVLGTGPAGRLLLASMTAHGKARMSDPVTGALVGNALPGGRHGLDFRAFGVGPGRRLLLVFADRHGEVQVKDVATDATVAEIYLGHTRPMGFGTGPEQNLLLASGGGLLSASTVEVRDTAHVLSNTNDLTLSISKALTGHTQPVTAVAFGTDRDARLLLASGSKDHTVRIWDPTASGNADEQLRRLKGWFQPTGDWIQPTGAKSVLDGRLLATDSDGQVIRVWERALNQNAGEDPYLQWGFDDTVVFGAAADGRLLAAGSDSRKVWVWDPVTGERVSGPLPYDDQFGRAVAFGVNPKNDRLLLAIGSLTETARVWDPLTSEPVGPPLSGQWATVSSLAFGISPGGRLLLAAGYGKTDYEYGNLPTEVRVWDALTSEPVGKPLTGHEGIVLSVAFGTGPDKRLLLASGSTDATVRLWEPLTSKPVGKPLIGHTAWVGPVAFGASSENGRLLLVSGGGDHTVRLWDPVTRACHAVLQRRSIVKSITAAGCMLGITDEEGVSVIELDERLRLSLASEMGPAVRRDLGVKRHRGSRRRWPRRRWLC
jgi:WD40 repeat protein